MAFVTSTEVVQYLGYSTTDTALNTEVALYVPIAENLAEEFCHTSFSPQTGVSYLYDGTGTEEIDLGRFLRSLTSVKIIDEDGLETSTIENAYLANDNTTGQPSRAIILRSGNKFPVGNQNIKITGDWGLNPVPATIKSAVALIVQHLFNLRAVDDTLIEERGFGREIKRKAVITQIPQAAKYILQYYAFKDVGE